MFNAKKPEFKEVGGKFQAKADYDMWLMEYGRLNDILMALSNYFISVRGNPALLLPIFDLLREFYRMLRPMMVEAVRKDKDEEVSYLKKTVDAELSNQVYYSTMGMQHYYVLNDDVLDELDRFFNSLMTYRQVMGLGVKASKRGPEKGNLSKAVDRLG